MNNGYKENNVSYHYKLFARLFVLTAMSSVTVCIKKTYEYRCKENVSYQCCSTVRTVHRPAMSSYSGLYSTDFPHGPETGPWIFGCVPVRSSTVQCSIVVI